MGSGIVRDISSAFSPSNFLNSFRSSMWCFAMYFSIWELASRRSTYPRPIVRSSAWVPSFLLFKLRGLDFYPGGTFTHCSCQPSLDAHSSCTVPVHSRERVERRSVPNCLRSRVRLQSPEAGHSNWTNSQFPSSYLSWQVILDLVYIVVSPGGDTDRSGVVIVLADLASTTF